MFLILPLVVTSIIVLAVSFIFRKIAKNYLLRGELPDEMAVAFSRLTFWQVVYCLFGAVCLYLWVFYLEATDKDLCRNGACLALMFGVISLMGFWCIVGLFIVPLIVRFSKFRIAGRVFVYKTSLWKLYGINFLIAVGVVGLFILCFKVEADIYRLMWGY